MKTPIILLSALALTGCASLTPEQQQSILDGLNRSLEAGAINQQQYQAAVAALTGGDYSELGQLGMELLRTGVDVGLALLGVRLWRGSTLARKGVAPAEPAK